MSAPELKPCPFCGADAKLMGGPMAQETYSVWCQAPRGQRHHLDGLGYKEAEAIAAWNRRADLCTPTDERVARLVDALRPFAFLDDSSTQEAWEIRYNDRFKDWIDFGDIEAARAALRDMGVET